MTYPTRRCSLALLLFAAAGCTAQVAVRPTTPRVARFGPPANDTVGLFSSPDFASYTAREEWGPVTIFFDLGRGGAAMVQEILQARFSRVQACDHAPPLGEGERPEVAAIFVPAWKDFSARQLDPQGNSEVAVVLELSLLRRDGSQVWTRSFSGQARGRLDPSDQSTSPEAAMSDIARQALEQAGAALAKELGRPQVTASVSEVREQAAAQAAEAAKGAARQQARRLYVHPFKGSGPQSAQAGNLEAAILARLLASARFVAVASGEQQQKVDAAIREVNRESVGEEEWIAIGKGRGAELMLSGQVASSGTTCSVKVELTDLSSRLMLSSFFRTLNPCAASSVLELTEPAAQAMLGGI